MGKKLKEKMDELKGKVPRRRPGARTQRQGARKDMVGGRSSHPTPSTRATPPQQLGGLRTGWLKANYPAEFMAAVLSRNLNDIAKLSFYMDECRAMGLDVKGPDINESQSSFSAGLQGVIRFGLSAIRA